MDQFATYLIEFLTDWRASPDWQQWLSVALLACSAVGTGIAVRRWARGKHDHYISEITRLEGHTERQQAVVDAKTAEIERLTTFDPDGLLATLDYERGPSRDYRNPGKMLAAAEAYVEAVRPGLAAAYPIIAEHHLGRFEGEDEALAEARAAALGSLATDPEDYDHRMTLDEIEALQRVETEEPKDQAEAKAREERRRLRTLLADAPGDAGALFRLGRKQVLARRYRTAIALLERAEPVAEAAPDGGALLLQIQSALGEANTEAGRYAEAREILAPLPKQFEAHPTFGARHNSTLVARARVAGLMLAEGQVRRARPLLAAILKDEMKALGPDHPNTLATEQKLADADLHLGRLAAAEQRLTTLLPRWIKAISAVRPRVETTRAMLADALLEQGKLDAARSVLAEMVVGGGTFLKAWVADLEGDTETAERLLAKYGTELRKYPPEHHYHRVYDKYVATRGPDGKDGTTLWMLDLPENREPEASPEAPAETQLG